MTHLTAARGIALLLLAVVVLTGVVTPPGVEAQVNVTGQWSTMSQLAPVQPVHVALLHTGKVLIVEGSSNDSQQTVYRYTIWNPATGSFSTGTTPWDLFCNSMSFFPDGRLLISGGTLSYNPFSGIRTTTIFDPATEQFIQVEDTAKGRWYPTTVMLQDGGVMSFSGLDESGVMNPDTEIYDIGFGWAGPYPAPFDPKYYPRLHLLKNGKVLMTGPDPFTRTFDPATGTWSGVITTNQYGDSRMYGSSVMLPLRAQDGYAQRFVAFGGNTSVPTAVAEILDTSAATWSWRSLPPLDQARVTHNAVMLPNGKILVVGGSAQFNVASTAAMNARMFDPATETWAPAGTIAFPRMYHSTAILLPDATVWLGGSNPVEGTWTPQMEIYKPPYLFTSSGAPAPRPSIASSPGVVGYGASFSVGTAQAQSISQVVLARAGSVTHAFDMEQRHIQLQFTKGNGTLSVTSPPNELIAPPGYYMLFVLDQNGVPSVASFIRVATNPSNQPPVATITNPTSSSVSIQTGQSVTFAGSASDADGSVTRYQWLFPGGSPGKSTVQNPGAVTFSSPGTYTASLTVLDNLGDNNVSPPTVTVVVGGTPTPPPPPPPPGGGDTTPPSVTITAPTTGVWTGNSINIAASATDNAALVSIKLWGNGGVFATLPCSGTTCSGDVWWITGSLPAGAYEVNAVALDAAGNQTVSTKVTIIKDATSPVIPSGASGGTPPPPPPPAQLGAAITSPANGATVSGNVTINMSASNVQGSPTSFVLQTGNTTISNQSVTGSTATATWNTSGLASGSYPLNLTVSNAGRTATASITVNVAASPPPPPPPPPGGGDTTPPSVTITAPTSGVWTGNSINIAASATDNVGLVSIKLWGNGSAFATLSCSGTTCSGNAWWVTGSLPAAAYEVNAVALDTAGNQSVSAKITIFKDATTPVIPSGASGGTAPPPPPPSQLGAAITSPANGQTVSGNVTVNMSASNVQGSPTSFLLQTGNTTISNQSVSGSTATATWNTTGLASGSYPLTLTVSNAGRTATASITVNVAASTPPPGGGDTTSPSVTITSPPNGAWTGNSIDVHVTGSDNVGLANLKVFGDGQLVETVPCNGTTCSGVVWWLTGSLPPGQHTISASATDTAGNTTTTPTVVINK